MKMTDAEALEKKLHGLPRYNIKLELNGSGESVIVETYPKQAVDDILASSSQALFIMNDKGEYINIERQAEWVLNPKSEAMTCSNCFREAYWDTSGRQIGFPYCPFCGARMITREEDDGREGQNDKR